MSFESIASLLLPADSQRNGAIVEADERWQFNRLERDPDVLVWGRPPLPSGMPLQSAARSALAREWILQRLARRTPRPWQRVTVHRWAPPVFGRARARERARASLLGGALVEMTAGPRLPRVVDLAAQAAGAARPVTQFAAGSGGSIVTRVMVEDGSSAVLRVGRSIDGASAVRGVEGLFWLTASGVTWVPRPMAIGHVAQAAWTLESALPGARISHLTEPLLSQLSRIFARVPVSDAPPTVVWEDLNRITAAFPRHGRVIDALTSFIRPVLRALPSVTRHGDLWSGNILVDRGALSGVIDWDGWHSRGVPGTDLLHLLAMDEALRTGRELGSIWLEAPWRSTGFLRLTTGYWQALDIWPNAATLQAIGISWWAGYVAHSLACDPSLRIDGRWIGHNIDAVLTALERVLI